MGGDPRTVRAKVGALDMGTYTVAWTVRSATDGHMLSGTYAFSVVGGIPVEVVTVGAVVLAGTALALSVPATIEQPPLDAVVLADPEHRSHALFAAVKDQITGVCKYCAKAFGATAAVEAAGVPLLDEYQQHPSLRTLVQDGFHVLVF